MFAPEAVVTIVAAAAVGVGLSYMGGSFLTGGRMAQDLPMTFHYMTQSSYIGYLMLDQLDPAKPPLVEEAAKDTCRFIENLNDIEPKDDKSEYFDI